MPTYEYRCKACGKQTDIFHSMTEAPKRKCPACGKNALERLIGTGGAVIFKGSGFYQTDYRSEGYRKAASAEENGASNGESKGGAKEKAGKESKPAAESGGSAGAKKKKTEAAPGS